MGATLKQISTLNKLVESYGDRVNELGFLYVLKSGEHYKIGHSRQLLSRIETLQIGNPITLELVFSYFCLDYKDKEKELHEHFANKRTFGEWFKLNRDDLNYIETTWQGTLL